MKAVVSLIQSNLTLGYVHEVWCETRITFILKTGRRNCDSSKDFWSISLTSFNFNTVEKLHW